MSEEEEYYAITRKAFDFLAPIYDVVTLPLGRVRERVVDLAMVAKDCAVLDVATGTGQQAFAFARRGCRVTGIDLTESMLKIARRHNTDDLVKFEAADARRLHFEKGTFDITCISFALHDMPLSVRKQVLNEMVRVTRTDGTIMIVDYDLPSNRIGSAMIYRLVTLYEGEYCRQFVASDLEMLLANSGIGVTATLRVLWGAGKIVRAKKQALEFPREVGGNLFRSTIPSVPI